MSDYLFHHYHDLIRALVEHIELSALALMIASIIALPLGYWLSRSRKFAGPVIVTLGAIYSIPSMALLVLFVPAFGLGRLSAILTLIIYAQFVLVRNSVLGFQSLDPAMIEAARGLGMNAFQRLIRVELPLAMPVLISGLRIAASSVIAIASMAALINAGGLGTILFEGIYQNHYPSILWGTILISGLALLAELALLDIEKRARLESLGQQMLGRGPSK